MTTINITAKLVRSAITEMSERSPDRFFLPADVAVKLLSDKFGMCKQLTAAEKSKAAGRVGPILRSMSDGSKTNLVKTEGKIEPRERHFPGIKKAVGYRVGEVNGNVGGSVRGVLNPPQRHPPQPNPPKNPVMQNALEAALYDDSKRVTLNGRGFTVEDRTKEPTDFTSLIGELSYDELSDLMLECQMRQAALFEAAQSKVAKVQETVAALNELNEEMA